MGLQTLLGEIKTIRRLLSKESPEEKKIIFYSESAIYYLYYQGFVDHLLKNSSHIVTYITSDLRDPVFDMASERFRVFHVSNAMMAFTTGLLNVKTLIFTMPDLGNYHIKRSTKKVDHIYVFHAIMSSHMIYRKGAFDHYDTIFCAGPHHLEEIRQTEKYYGLKEKRLIRVGYPLLERIHAEHIAYDRLFGDEQRAEPVILIAPTWNEGNIVETCIEELIASFLAANYRVILRPHPETYKLHKNAINAAIEKYRDKPGFELERKLTSVENFHRADILVTDWSGIAFEYAFGTERPVLFVNTLRKVHNSDYERIGIEPLEVKVRNKIGAELEVGDIAGAGSLAGELLSKRAQYKEAIIRYREEYIYNWGSASEAGGRYIMEALERGELQK